MLTALGIIFGVAAVISMLAIGAGAKQEILEQIKMVGVNNIVISTLIPEEPESGEESNSGNNASGEKKKFSPGLTLLDVEAIHQVVPGIKTVCPEIALNSFVIQNGKRIDTKIIGVARSYFDLYNLPLEKGVLFDK